MAVAPGSQDRACVVVEAIKLRGRRGPGRNEGEPSAEKKELVRFEQVVLQLHVVEPFFREAGECDFVFGFVGLFD